MDFPPEIIKCVLSHLEFDDLKKCLLVSDDIRELIIKTPELMRKFDVILFHETWKEKMPFIKKYGYFIRSVRCNDVGFDDEDQFKRILKYTPNLERLTFTDCYIVTPEEDEGNENEDEELARNNEPNVEVAGENAPEQNIENPDVAENNNDEIVINENPIENNEVVQNEPENLEDPQINDNVAHNEPEAISLQVVAEQNALENVEGPAVNDNDESRQNAPEENNPQVIFEDNDNAGLNENVIPQDVNVENNLQVENVPENIQIVNETVKKELDDPEEVIESEIQLKKLTYLHLESSTFAEGLVKYIQSCNKLKYFKLTFYYQEPKTEFTQFVCQQNELEELILQGYSDMVFKSLFHVDINEMAKFKLKKLSLECELCHHRHFSSFFRAQGEHIKELTISCYNIDFHYYRILFNNFKKLDTLVLPTDWTLNDSRSLLIKDLRLDRVKDLELVGSNDDLETFRTFINIFPNVEKLKCENLSNFSLQGILENFHHLSSIHVDNFRCDTMLFVKMPALKHLDIEFLSATGHNFFWEKMTHDCPNIEVLHIDEIGHFKLNASIKVEFRIIIQNLKNLKQLKTCRIACCPHDNSLNPDEDANANERLPEENPFYKVEIDTTAKTIKVSNQFANRCSEEVELIREIFKECDIVEF